MELMVDSLRKTINEEEIVKETVQSHVRDLYCAFIAVHGLTKRWTGDYSSLGTIDKCQFYFNILYRKSRRGTDRAKKLLHLSLQMYAHIRTTSLVVQTTNKQHRPTQNIIFQRKCKEKWGWLLKEEEEIKMCRISISSNYSLHLGNLM